MSTALFLLRRLPRRHQIAIRLPKLVERTGLKTKKPFCGEVLGHCKGSICHTSANKSYQQCSLLFVTLTLTSQYSHGLPPSPRVSQRVNRPSPDSTGTYSEPWTSCTLHMLHVFDVAPHADLARNKRMLGLPSSPTRPKQHRVVNRRVIESHQLRDSIVFSNQNRCKQRAAVKFPFGSSSACVAHFFRLEDGM